MYIVRFLHQTTTCGCGTSCGCWLYIVRFLHQTTTCRLALHLIICCISSVSYIKPQLDSLRSGTAQSCISSVSYIKPQLQKAPKASEICCISSVSYIKPQLSFVILVLNNGCISSVSYIKPQQNVPSPFVPKVVYRPFPTSNHNTCLPIFTLPSVVYRPFPTSNHNYHYVYKGHPALYIVRFLHQTTT